MRKGDLVFVQGKGLISWIVRLFDGKGRFSHVAVAISDSRVVEADVGTKVTMRTFDEDKYNIVEVVDLGLTYEERLNVHATALKFIGMKYDYLQLLWYVLRRIFNLKGKNKLNNPRDMICSELAFHVLDSVGILDDLGIKDTAFNGADLTPNELYDLVTYISKHNKGS